MYTHWLEKLLIKSYGEKVIIRRKCNWLGHNVRSNDSIAKQALEWTRQDGNATQAEDQAPCFTLWSR